MKRILLIIVLIIAVIQLIVLAIVAVEFQTKSEVKVASGTEITIPIPTGWSVDDLLICFICKDDDDVITPPGGDLWTTIQAGESLNATYTYVAYRIAETGDTEWTWTGDSESYYGVMLRYTGQDTTTPIYGSGLSAGSDPNPIAPSVDFTDLETGSLCLQVFGADGVAVPYTVPGTLTSRFNDSETSTGGAGGDKAVSGTGSTGTGDFTMNALEQWVAITVVIEAAEEAAYNYFGHYY